MPINVFEIYISIPCNKSIVCFIHLIIYFKWSALYYFATLARVLALINYVLKMFCCANTLFYVAFFINIVILLKYYTDKKT